MKGLKLFLIAGLIFVFLGAIGIGIDIGRSMKYDTVKADVHIVNGNMGNEQDRKKAHVDYEYNGQTYTDIPLNTFNQFAMRDGSKTTILVVPEDPARVYPTSYLLHGVILAFGAIGVAAGSKKTRTDD